MSLEELNTYFNLIDRLEQAKEILRNLESAVCPGAQVLTGMPHSTGAKDKLGDLAAEIVDVEARIKYLEDEIDKHKKAVEEFVKSIDDVWYKTVFRLRFERGLAWKTVAAVMGGGNSENSVKSACYRYLKKLQRDDAS